jgi:ribosomal protein L9
VFLDTIQQELDFLDQIVQEGIAGDAAKVAAGVAGALLIKHGIDDKKRDAEIQKRKKWREQKSKAKARKEEQEKAQKQREREAAKRQREAQDK